MMSTVAPDSKDIINLLEKLKSETPDYPAELFAARKTAYLKQAAAIKIQINSQGGDGGASGGGSGSGAALGGSTTAPGIGFQALIAFGFVVAMLVGAFLVSDANDDFYGHTTAVVEKEHSELSILPLTGGSPELNGEESLTPTPVPSEIIPTLEVKVSIPSLSDEMEETIFDEIAEMKKEKKPNPGLHLGQADGTPAAPGQGNPGNINQPDKPENPNKPDKDNGNNKGNDKGKEK